MDRVQKKCLIVSASLHSLLVVILLVGPAFLVSKSKPDNLPLLDFVPIMTTDAQTSGGGTHNANSAPPAPPQPPQSPPETKQEPPPKVHEPDPPKDPVKDNKPDPDSLTPATKKPKIEVSTKIVTRNRDDAKADAKAKADKEAAQQRAAQQRIASEVEQAARNIGNGVAGGVSLQLEGPGGGGVPYANFFAAVKSVYTRAWIVPDGMADDEATVTASVTIARDGSVVRSKITHSSGNMAIDRSVQATLDRVTFVAPLPQNAKEDQRTVTINFNAKAKRLLG